MKNCCVHTHTLNCVLIHERRALRVPICEQCQHSGHSIVSRLKRESLEVPSFHFCIHCHSPFLILCRKLTHFKFNFKNSHLQIVFSVALFFLTNHLDDHDLFAEMRSSPNERRRLDSFNEINGCDELQINKTPSLSHNQRWQITSTYSLGIQRKSMYPFYAQNDFPTTLSKSRFIFGANFVRDKFRFGSYEM